MLVFTKLASCVEHLGYLLKIQISKASLGDYDLVGLESG
jgi:hypothetical protein